MIRRTLQHVGERCGRALRSPPVAGRCRSSTEPAGSTLDRRADPAATGPDAGASRTRAQPVPTLRRRAGRDEPRHSPRRRATEPRTGPAGGAGSRRRRRWTRSRAAPVALRRRGGDASASPWASRPCRDSGPWRPAACETPVVSPILAAGPPVRGHHAPAARHPRGSPGRTPRLRRQRGRTTCATGRRCAARTVRPCRRAQVPTGGSRCRESSVAQIPGEPTRGAPCRGRVLGVSTREVRAGYAV